MLCSSLVLLLSSCSTAVAQGTSAPELPGDSPDAMLVQQAGETGIADAELSRIAVDHAQSAGVRRFAEELVREHERSNRELAMIAAHENISVPKEISDTHAHLRTQLAVLHGADFDRAYLDAMRDDHRRLADLLRSSRATVSTQELRTWITLTLPVVQDHLRETRAIHIE